MRIIHFFNLKRLYLLIKKDFYTQYKTYLMALGAIFCVLFIVNITSIANEQSCNFNLIFYPLTLFIGGFIFTSLSFNELCQEQNRIFYLSIPASSLEKFISKLLITSLGYVVVSLLLYFLFSLIVFSLTSLIFGHTHAFFNPSHPHIRLCIRIYLITQSVFLLGAIYFRNNSLIKTILFLFIFSIVYTAFVAGIAFIFFKIISFNKQIYFSFEFFNMFFQENVNLPPLINNIRSFIISTSQIFFWFLLAPIFWAVSFFRLKETEAKCDF